MSDQSNIDLPPTNLVELLYGELEGEEETAAEKQVAGDVDLTTKIEGYHRLRKLMRALPEEEPPASITAQLLHAAAAHAPAPPKPEGGFFAWLQRLVQPLVLHPAMAAAATFVVVAGVAGTLYLSGKVGVSEPRAPSGARPPAATPSDKREAPEPSRGELGKNVDLPASHFEDDIVVEGEITKSPAGAAGVAQPNQPATGSLEFDTKLEGRRQLEVAPKAPPRDSVETPTAGKKKAKATKKPTDTKAAEKLPVADPSPDVVSNSKTDVIPVETRPPPLKQLDEDDGEADSEATNQEKEAARRQAMAQSWHAKAVQAAQDGECDAVIEIGNRVRQLDSHYYDTVYLRDTRLKACRAQAPQPKK